MDTEICYSTDEETTASRKIRQLKADRAHVERCRTLICVLENPGKPGNIGAFIRIIDTLGVSKLYS